MSTKLFLSTVSPDFAGGTLSAPQPPVTCAHQLGRRPRPASSSDKKAAHRGNKDSPGPSLRGYAVLTAKFGRIRRKSRAEGDPCFPPGKGISRMICCGLLDSGNVARRASDLLSVQNSGSPRWKFKSIRKPEPKSESSYPAPIYPSFSRCRITCWAHSSGVVPTVSNTRSASSGTS